MTGNWFQVAVTYGKVMENGIQKKVTEYYLVDALSFAEAEARAIEEMRPFISGEFHVSAVGKKKYSELFQSETGDKYYHCKTNFITLDEKNGSEKKTPCAMLVQASTVKDAIDVLENGMKGTMASWDLTGVTETKIIDVFKYAESK